MQRILCELRCCCYVQWVSLLHDCVSVVQVMSSEWSEKERYCENTKIFSTLTCCCFFVGCPVCTAQLESFFSIVWINIYVLLKLTDDACQVVENCKFLGASQRLLVHNSASNEKVFLSSSYSWSIVSSLCLCLASTASASKWLEILKDLHISIATTDNDWLHFFFLFLLHCRLLRRRWFEGRAALSWTEFGKRIDQKSLIFCISVRNVVLPSWLKRSEMGWWN